MATVNIPSTLTDPNYRYKMPRLMSKVEGRGNGIKTNIMNMGEIAKALKRPPEYPTKFFGCELGALSKYENKEEKAIVNGAHEQSELQKLIDKFIEKFVLCPECCLPELDLLVKKNTVSGKCNACGHFCELDNQHRVATYITKNPPGGGDSTMGKKITSSKKGKDTVLREEKHKDGKELKREKTAELADSDEKDGSVHQQEGGESNSKKKKKDKDKKHKKKSTKSDDETGDDMSPTVKGSSAEQGPNGTNNGTNAEDGDGGGKKGHDGKEKKKKKESREKLLRNESLNFDSPEIDEICARMREFVSNKEASMSPTDFFQEIRMLQISQVFGGKIRMFVALDGLFSSTGITPTGIEKKLPFLLEIVDSSVTVADICSGLETYVVTKCPQNLREFPFMLQKLYQGDVLEDEKALLSYYEADTSSQSPVEIFSKAKKFGEPFLRGLRNSQEEDDSSSEEDDEEVVSTPASRGQVLKSLNMDADRPVAVIAKPVAHPQAVPEAPPIGIDESLSDSDVDIDAL